MKSPAQIIREHHVKMGAKGGRNGKGSERRRWAAKLANAIRWGKPAAEEEARKKLSELQP